MKRIHIFSIAAALLLACAFTLGGCGGQDKTTASADTGSKASLEEQETSALSSEASKDEATPAADTNADPNTGSISNSGANSTTNSTGSSDATAADSSGSSNASHAGNSNGQPGGSSGSNGSHAGNSTPSSAGGLHVSGTQLCDSAGNPVQLRGISTHGLAWFPDYVNESCFADFKNNWNANVVRLAMYTAEYGGYCSGGDTSYLKNLVRSGIQYAASQDMYVIVDWHILSDGNPNSHLSEAKAFFNEISSEYSGSSHILYEICNEPNGGTSWSQIKSYALEVIPVIRANDPDAVIIVGTPNWSQYVDQAAADPITEYDNLMYALHFYAATHKEDLRSKMTNALSSGLPIFVTEYGICDASGNGGLDIDQANQWVSTMDQWGVSYVAWNLSNKNESSAILKSSCSKTSGFTQEDLSDSGKWLYETLTGHSGGPVAAQPPASASLGNASADNSQQPAPVQQPATNQQPAPSQQPAANQQPASNPPAPSDSGNTTPPAPENNTAITNDNGIQVTASIINNWENDGQPYYQYTLTLKNTTGQNCSSWSIHLPCESTMNLSDSWNGQYSVSGGQLNISSMDYNGTIPAGGSIDNIGFIVYGGKLQ